MSRRRILIGDCSGDFTAALAEDLNWDVQVKICWSGAEVLQQAPVFRPDGMVLDLNLERSDGLSLFQELYRNGKPCPVLVTTRFVSDYVVDSLTKLGVDYLMVKPCDTRAVSRRLRDIMTYAQPVETEETEQSKIVSGILLELGVSPKRRGFSCAREAILLQCRNPGQSVTKELYPAVGKTLDTSPGQVEHAIRTAVVSAWQNGDREIWNRYFPADPQKELHWPSNGKFISCLAERLRGD